MEAKYFYNALNVLFDGNYSKLSSLFKKYGNWEAAFLAHENLDAEKERVKLKEAGVSLILKDSPDFPELLREIPYPPFALYIKGSLDTAMPGVAIVGTRKATEEGLSLAHDFASHLAAHGVNVLSGLAFGVDRSAHEGALNSSGKTTAVLPSGLDSPYPASHAVLAQKILDKGGALVSEYPLGHKPTHYNFLERNRLISGLSKGAVIIEAPERSGALATARFALEQNREVYVVPGPAKHRNYAGSHMLIKSGAALVTAPEDVLQSLGISVSEEAELASLEEKAILKVLRSVGRPLSMEEIVETTGISASLASQTISFLVLQSKVRDNGTAYSI